MTTTNDSIILTLDELEFTWRTARTMHGYLIGVSADNLGTLQVRESVAPTTIRHRPSRGRPFRWPLGHDGFVFYQRTGGLPDIVEYALLVVRDRWAIRQVGAVLAGLGKDAEFEELSRGVSGVMMRSAPVVGVALDLLHPAIDAVARVLQGLGDTVLDTVTGGIHLHADTAEESELEDTVEGAFVRASLDFHVFDARVDFDSAADIRGSMESLRRSGLLIGGDRDHR